MLSVRTANACLPGSLLCVSTTATGTAIDRSLCEGFQYTDMACKVFYRATDQQASISIVFEATATPGHQTQPKRLATPMPIANPFRKSLQSPPPIKYLSFSEEIEWVPAGNVELMAVTVKQRTMDINKALVLPFVNMFSPLLPKCDPH